MTRAARGEEPYLGGDGGVQSADGLRCRGYRPAEAQAERPHGLSVKTEHAEVTIIPDRPRDSQTSDSDSDGSIVYRDEEEEEDEYTNSTKQVTSDRRGTVNKPESKVY